MSKLKILLAAVFALSLFAVSCGSDDAAPAAQNADDSEAVADSDTADGDDEAMDNEAMDDEATDNEATDNEATDNEATDDDATDDDGAMDDGAFPVTIESAGGTFTLESAPQRIVSLSPSATEMLFAVGAGDQIIAVDAFSYYPSDAPVTDLSGWDPNVEAVLSYEPDMVVIANDANDLVASLTALDIPVFVAAAPADIESGYASLADLGVAVGHVDQTADVIANMRSQVAEALAFAPDATGLRIYHELDDTFFSASSFGFVGAIYAEMGVENIADAADEDGYGFPQLSQEYIVETDPQLIVITDQVSYTADDVAARPGWDQISAVQQGNVVVVNADIASRWGPRLPQFIRVVAEALTAASVAA